ncbi:MAG TPA: response regulator [bacterium]|nr:response regulator [bacterium]
MIDAMRILIADDEPVIRMGLRTMLEEHDYKVVGEAGDGEEAVTLAGKLAPDLIFMDIKMPGLDGISAASTIMTRQPRPIILLTAWSERDLVQRAQEAGVLAYLVKPVREAELVPVIEVAMARFAELRALQQEVGNLKETLETRKLVDRAKGILMQREGIDEQEAFLRIQRQSRNSRTPMREIARAILVSDEMRQHTPARPAGRIDVRTPADLLRVLSAVRMMPGSTDQPDLVVSGAEPLAYLRFTPGVDVSVEGHVTARGPEGEYGLGVAFGLAPSTGESDGGIIACVIQNTIRPGALDAGGTAHSQYAQLLDEVIATQQRVTVTGLLRLLPDHASGTHPAVPRLLEIHPVRSVTTERGLTFPPIPVDAPGGAEWTQVESVHPMPFPDFQPSTRVAFTGGTMTFRHAPVTETAYVYMTGQFYGGRSQFVDGRPFLFAFGDAAGRTRITAVAAPSTPAYDTVRRWLTTPPSGPLTIVGLRTLHLPALFAPGGGRIEVFLCPVFRILPGAVKGAGVPAPTTMFELVPVGGVEAAPAAPRRAAAKTSKPRTRAKPGAKKAPKPARAAAKRAGPKARAKHPARRPAGSRPAASGARRKHR